MGAATSKGRGGQKTSEEALRAAVAEKDKQLAEMDKKLAEKDKMLAEKDKMLAAKKGTQAGKGTRNAAAAPTADAATVNRLEVELAQTKEALLLAQQQAAMQAAAIAAAVAAEAVKLAEMAKEKERLEAELAEEKERLEGELAEKDKQIAAAAAKEKELMAALQTRASDERQRQNESEQLARRFDISSIECKFPLTNTAFLEWNAVPIEGMTYVVEGKQTGCSTWTRIEDAATKMNTTWKGLAPATEYTARVRAAGAAEFVNSVKFRTKPRP